MKPKILVTAALALALLFGGSHDVLAQGGRATRIRNGSTLPTNCEPGKGHLFLKTTAPVGLHHCPATDTWVQLADAEDILSFFASTTSAQLRAVLSDGIGDDGGALFAAFVSAAIGDVVCVDGVSPTSLGNCTLNILVVNEGATGTTINHFVSLTGAPSTAIITSSGATGGVVGVCIAGCGTTGNAEIQVTGIAQVDLDGATAAGNYVQISNSVNGEGTDAGSTYPTTEQVMGLVTQTIGAAGLANVMLFAPESRDSGAAATVISKWYVDGASCIGATPTNNWDDAGTGDTAPTAACNDTGSIQRPSADFAGGAVNSFERTFRLTDDWNDAEDVDISIRYVTVAGSPTGNVEWDISTVCRAVGESWDGSFNAIQTITDAVAAQNVLNEAVQTAVTMTGCAVNEDWTLKISRDGTSDSNNDTAKLLGVMITLRRI